MLLGYLSSFTLKMLVKPIPVHPFPPPPSTASRRRHPSHDRGGAIARRHRDGGAHGSQRERGPPLDKVDGPADGAVVPVDEEPRGETLGMEGMTARVEAEDIVLAGLDTGGGSVGPLPSVAGPGTGVLGSVPFVPFLCVCLGRGYAVFAVGGCCCCCCCTALLVVVGGPRGGAFAGTGIGARIGGRLPVCRGGAAAGRPERRDLVEDFACVEAVFLVRWFRDERSNADGTVGFVSQSSFSPVFISIVPGRLVTTITPPDFGV